MTYGKEDALPWISPPALALSVVKRGRMTGNYIPLSLFLRSQQMKGPVDIDVSKRLEILKLSKPKVSYSGNLGGCHLKLFRSLLSKLPITQPTTQGGKGIVINFLSKFM